MSMLWQEIFQLMSVSSARLEATRVVKLVFYFAHHCTLSALLAHNVLSINICEMNEAKHLLPHFNFTGLQLYKNFSTCIYLNKICQKDNNKWCHFKMWSMSSHARGTAFKSQIFGMLKQRKITLGLSLGQQNVPKNCLQR